MGWRSIKGEDHGLNSQPGDVWVDEERESALSGSLSVDCSTPLTFNEKVMVMMKFFESIGPRKAAEFTVHLDEAVKGLGLNNDEFVREFQRIYKP